MKKIGCGLVIVGVLFLVGSVALFGFSITRAIEAKQVASIPIEIGEQTTTDVINVDTERLCQIELAATVSSDSVQEEDEHQFEGDDPDFELRYDFPFEFTVLNADGKNLTSGSDRLHWNEGMRSSMGGIVDAEGGTLHVEHSYDKFEVPPPGRIQVEVEVDPDTTYGAEAKNLKLNIYDNVSAQGASVFGGFTMLCFGPLLIGTGLVVFVIGLLIPPQPATPRPEDQF